MLSSFYRFFIFEPIKANIMKLKYILIAISFFIAAINLQAQSKVGTVNVNTVLSKLPELIQVQQQIKDYNQELGKTLEEKVTTYQAKIDAYKKGEAAFSDVMKKTKQQEIVGLENDINKFRENGTKLVQIRQDKLMRPLYKKISETIEAVAKEQKYTQVLTTDGNEFAYADANFDLTKTVMQKLGLKTE